MFLAIGDVERVIGSAHHNDYVRKSCLDFFGEPQTQRFISCVIAEADDSGKRLALEPFAHLFRPFEQTDLDRVTVLLLAIVAMQPMALGITSEAMVCCV